MSIADLSTSQIEWLFEGDGPYHGCPAYLPGRDPGPYVGARVVVGPLTARFRGRPLVRHCATGYLARMAGVSIATWRTQMPDFSRTPPPVEVVP